jgi:hypothetical protein
MLAILSFLAALSINILLLLLHQAASAFVALTTLSALGAVLLILWVPLRSAERPA